MTNQAIKLKVLQLFGKLDTLFIKENLINVEIDLINENFFKNALKSIADKGGEFFNKVKSKIENIQANLKSIISGVIEFLKSFVKKLVESIIPSEELIQKAKGELKSNINDTINVIGCRNQKPTTTCSGRRRVLALTA